jgi:two-component system sensor histidine kinase YesM
MDPEVRGLRIPKLILQPMVENAVEHGLIPSRSDKKIIRISGGLSKDRNSVYLYVADNGAGLSETELADIRLMLDRKRRTQDGERQSIGLSNVHVRIGLICGESYGIHVLSRRGLGTCVVYQLPMKGMGQ